MALGQGGYERYTRCGTGPWAQIRDPIADVRTNGSGPQWVRAGHSGDFAETGRGSTRARAHVLPRPATPALRSPVRRTADGEDRQVVLLHPGGELPHIVDE